MRGPTSPPRFTRNGPFSNPTNGTQSRDKDSPALASGVTRAEHASVDTHTRTHGRQSVVNSDMFGGNMGQDFSHAGTLIQGTHREEELIPAFAGALVELHPTGLMQICADFALVLTPTDSWADEVPVERWSELVFLLFEALEMAAPEGYYFGAHEGDGADYGYWMVSDADLQ